MKRILCPIDFSNASMAGLKYAFGIAQQLNCDLLLFHATHPSPVIAPDAVVHTDNGYLAQEEAKEKLEVICEDLARKNHYKRINYSFFTREGFAEEAILETITDRNIDMIITGTKGADGMKTLLGTISADLAMKAKCPVLVVPEIYEYKELHKIIAAIDSSDKNTDQTYLALSIAKCYNAHLTFLNIHSSGISELQSSIEKEMDLLKGERYSNISFHGIEHNKSIEGITQFATEAGADLLVITSNSSKTTHNLFSKKFTKQLSFHTHIPILVMHKKK